MGACRMMPLLLTLAVVLLLATAAAAAGGELPMSVVGRSHENALTRLADATTAGGDLPMSVVGRNHENALTRLADDATTAAERHISVVTGAGASADGAVEDGKAYIVGRPLFKVPPSNPCRAKSARC